MVKSHQNYIPVAFSLGKYFVVFEDNKLVIFRIVNKYEYNICYIYKTTIKQLICYISTIPYSYKNEKKIT